MSDDADRINYALNDARALCDALGLLEGHIGRGWSKQAGGVMVRCPWHDEKSPSCSITRGPDGTIRARCFGCGATGNVFDVVAAVERLDKRADFVRVLEIAADIAGVARPDTDRPSSRTSWVRPVLQRPPPVEEPDDGVIARVAEVLARVAPVTRSPEAMRYLRSRGLEHGPALGWYAVPNGDARDRVVAAILEAVGYEAWMASGLSSVEGPRAGRWSYAWSGPRLVIPWRAPNGTVETLQGRYIGECPEGVRKYVFPRERRPRWPYGCDAMAESCGPDTAVAIVEGVIDAVSFDLLAARSGVDAMALAIPGVQAWRESWLKLCARRPCIVALDADDAGERGSSGIAASLLAVARRGPRGPMVTIRKPVNGKDWNDAWRAA